MVRALSLYGNSGTESVLQADSARKRSVALMSGDQRWQARLQLIFTSVNINSVREPGTGMGVWWTFRVGDSSLSSADPGTAGVAWEGLVKAYLDSTWKPLQGPMPTRIVASYFAKDEVWSRRAFAHWASHSPAQRAASLALAPLLAQVGSDMVTKSSCKYEHLVFAYPLGFNVSATLSVRRQHSLTETEQRRTGSTKQ